LSGKFVGREFYTGFEELFVVFEVDFFVFDGKGAYFLGGGLVEVDG
jgi:hypothetical protein